jgi:hypothetical protein
MIQYPVSLRDLARRVSKRLPAKKSGQPSWRVRARNETERLRGQGAYSGDEKTEIWKELKPIFAALQGNGKCAFCEQMLAVHKRGGVSGDMDHYRPKRGVEVWLNTHAIPVGGPDPDSYYLLAFHLRNYVLVCEICNRSYKQNYFPIAGPRCPAHTRRPRDLKNERPYLPHPLDPTDEDPEDLIEFEGIVPVPRAAQGTPQYWRAVVTIELLGLTGGNRIDLDFDRALIISILYQAPISTDPTDPVTARTLAALQDDTSLHRNCARSFKRLFDTDQARAKLLVDQAGKYVDNVRRDRRNTL